MLWIEANCFPEHVPRLGVVSEFAIDYTHQVERLKLVRVLAEIILDDGKRGLEVREQYQELGVGDLSHSVPRIEP